jgi:hypothetical protein
MKRLQGPREIGSRVEINLLSAVVNKLPIIIEAIMLLILKELQMLELIRKIQNLLSENQENIQQE